LSWKPIVSFEKVVNAYEDLELTAEGMYSIEVCILGLLSKCGCEQSAQLVTAA
jgi:hypothetical protein